MIKSIKASSDCLFFFVLRLPFEFSRARLGVGVCLIVSFVLFLGICALALKWWRIYLQKKTHKVGWRDCISAVFFLFLIYKGSSIHNSYGVVGGVLVYVCVYVCVLGGYHSNLYLILCADNGRTSDRATARPLRLSSPSFSDNSQICHICILLRSVAPELLELRPVWECKQQGKL